MADGSKEIPLKCRPRPSLFFHTLDLHQHAKHSSRKKTKSPRKKQGGRRRGQGRERETRQSPGWLFLALLIVRDFCLVLFATPCHYYLHTGSKLCGGCPLGLVFPDLYFKRWTLEGSETAGSEGPVQEWRAGMTCRKQRQHCTKLSSCTSMKKQNGNSRLEGGIGKKKLFEALALWTAC